MYESVCVDMYSVVNDKEKNCKIEMKRIQKSFRQMYEKCWEGKDNICVKGYEWKCWK